MVCVPKHVLSVSAPFRAALGSNDQFDHSTPCLCPSGPIRAPCSFADEAALDVTRVALLNQASGLIHLQKFGEAEARCTKLLTSSGSTAGRGRDGGGDARTRALHFRGFARYSSRGDGNVTPYT